MDAHVRRAVHGEETCLRTVALQLLRPLGGGRQIVNCVPPACRKHVQYAGGPAVEREQHERRWQAPDGSREHRQWWPARDPPTSLCAGSSVQCTGPPGRELQQFLDTTVNSTGSLEIRSSLWADRRESAQNLVTGGPAAKRAAEVLDAVAPTLGNFPAPVTSPARCNHHRCSKKSTP
jgi:hypothetical protein